MVLILTPYSIYIVRISLIVGQPTIPTAIYIYNLKYDRYLSSFNEKNSCVLPSPLKGRCVLWLHEKEWTYLTVFYRCYYYSLLPIYMIRYFITVLYFKCICFADTTTTKISWRKCTGNDTRTSSTSMDWWWLVRPKLVSRWRRLNRVEVQARIVILIIHIILIICIRQDHRVRNIHRHLHHPLRHHRHLRHIIVGLTTDTLHQRSIKNSLFFICDNVNNFLLN